jgi:hypothetical protein
MRDGDVIMSEKPPAYEDVQDEEAAVDEVVDNWLSEKRRIATGVQNHPAVGKLIMRLRQTRGLMRGR